MKKIISKLLISSSALLLSGISSLAIISCGSKTDNTNIYQAVLQQAVVEVLADKRKETAKITQSKQEYSISINDITTKAAIIIKAEKLDISTDYFKHLYLFASFTPDPTQSIKNTVTVTQNDNTSPTNIKIEYDNKGFSTSSSITAEPASSLLGQISIDIKQRHGSTMESLLSTIKYNLNNTAYFNRTNPQWGNSVKTKSSFVLGTDPNGTVMTTNLPQTWLSVSINPNLPSQIIGVANNGIWYSYDNGTTWALSNLTNKSDKTLIGFKADASKPTISADSAQIVWANNTAYISVNHLPDRGIYTQDNPREQYQKWYAAGATSLGDLWVARLGKETSKPGSNSGNDLWTAASGTGSKAKTTIAPILFSGKLDNRKPGVEANGFQLDNKDNLYWAQTRPVGNDNGGGIFEETAADIAQLKNIYDNGGQLKITSYKSGMLNPGKNICLGFSMSPNHKNIWAYYTAGYIDHITITNNVLGAPTPGIQFGENGSTDKVTAAVASNTGAYVVVGGTDQQLFDETSYTNRAGIATNLAFLSNKNYKIGDQVKVSGTKSEGFWTYSYMGDASGNNAYEMISTGVKGHTYIMKPNRAGEFGEPIESDFNGYCPYGAIANPNNANLNNQSYKNKSLVLNASIIVKGPNSKGSTSWRNALGPNNYFLANNHKSIDALNGVTFSTTHISALLGPLGYLAVNNEIFDTNNLSNKPKMIAPDKDGVVPTFSKLLNAQKNQAIFKVSGISEYDSIDLVGITVVYSGSNLSWNIQNSN